jgi:serine/threonine protein kinase/tetratricopeptide (TPR) repeat protein
MSAHDWKEVEELLHQAMALAPEQRAEFLEGACGSDAELRAELNSLLMVGENLSDGFLKSPLRGVLGQEIGEIDSATVLAAGQIFAQRFELIRKLGEGGMGQVWLAEQVSPVRRQVAVKLIKAGMYDEAVVQRFQSERQSLAIMDHPAIAKVFDAGTTPQGQPYLVMEFVPGLPITDYCDQHKLNIRERLELFIHACEGVQHAHQKAIIHRDLKPSNILVIEVDGNPTPRIIDFGLAKTTAPQLSGESLFTQLGQFIGTPGYMSPEQASPSARDIDTRTDVYTLGVVLYVLLTGLQPFEIKRREKPSLEEWLRQLREEEPPNPSTKVSGDKNTSSATAEARGTEPKQLISKLRGDLDWITMKALERDRTRRYGTPSELAADLRRYLNDEAVMARPASAAYQLRKYARRHRAAMGVCTGLLAMLAVFSVVQTLQLRETTQQRDHAKQERDRANLERDRANQERDRATRITDFMTGMFKVPDPSEARGNSVTAREILDRAANDVGKGLAQDPNVQSQMLHDMATTYDNLGLIARAHELAQRALDARSGLHGPDDPKTLESMAQLGLILHQEGHDLEAEKVEREALAGERRVLGAEAPLTLETMDNLAVSLKPLGNLSEAEKLGREVIEVGSRTLGPESALTLMAMGHLGSFLFYEGRYADCEKVLRQALDVERRVWGTDHPETLKALTMLAIAIHHQGRLAEAEPLYREVLSTSERVLGSQHRSTVGAMENLANVLVDEGHLAEGEKLDREVLPILVRTAGPDHTVTLIAQLNLALVLLKEGHLRDAERLQRETLAAELRVHGPQNPDTLSTQTDLAETLLRERRYTEAKALARETFEIQRRTLGPQHPDSLETLQELGTAMAFSGQYAEASKLFRDVIEEGNDSTTQGNRWSAWYRFARMAAKAKHPDDALEYLKEAIKRGFKNADDLLVDENLKNLRGNADFQQLVVELKKSVTSGQAK